MVDLHSGRLIAIDFGHAFGTATEVLPVPELVPFRLTRQIELLFMPYGYEAFLKDPMTNVLAALRENSDAILTVMNIFLKEPLTEWKSFSLRTNKNKNSTQWYPQKKMEIIRKKLSGVNTCHITAEELELGHGSKPYYSSVKKVLMGREGRFRFTIGAECASVHEQVSCLLDQATDPSILGRAWIGWSAWC